jgi:hypothetical protein
MSTNGSGLFTDQKAKIPHSMTREVEDLRNDVTGVLKPMCAMTVDEFTNALTAAAAGLRAATQPSLTAATVLEAALLQAGRDELAANPRNVTFTTAGSTPADAPATALITGFDAEGKAQTETVNLAQTATIANGVKAWSKITSIAFAAADGAADCTIAIGYGVTLGLTKTPKSRAGLAGAVREVSGGAVVTTGTLSAANKTYTPAAAPDGSRDYAVYYEYDPLV